MPTDKQRRQAERRRMQRQLERRREREIARRRRNLIISIVGALVVIGVVVTFIVQTGSESGTPTAGKSDSIPSKNAASSSSPAASSSSAADVPAYPCTWTKKGTAAKKATVPPTTKPSRTGTAKVTLATTRGTLTFTLDRKNAPCATESFISLAKQQYFDKTPCHRLVTKGIYVLQCGDPSGTGSGGPGYSFGDEVNGKEKYTRGVLAMANSGADTNGSQFFIVYKDSTSLPPNYTVFGRVTGGLNVVDKVAAAGSATAGDGKPKLSISITKATVG